MFGALLKQNCVALYEIIVFFTRIASKTKALHLKFYNF